MEKISKRHATTLLSPMTCKSHWWGAAMRGFTLIELMVVLVIIAIIAAIAIPSYQAYARQADASLAQQEMQIISEQLARHKAKNFTYRDFDPNYIYGQTGAMTSVTIPRGASGSAIKYTLTIRDAEDSTKLLTDATIRARGWTIKAIPTDTRNYTLLMTSAGIHCRNKTAANVSYENCGTTGSEGW